MKVRIQAAALKHSHWYGHVLRFVLGARGRRAALLAAAGAAMGSIGLAAFAFVAWHALGRTPTPVALAEATLAWAVVAGLVWLGRLRMARQPYGPNLQPRHRSRRDS